MKKVFFLFAWLLTCVCTVQMNAGNVITSIGSNITDVSQITNGSYYIFKSAQYGFLYENATTGRIDPGSGAVVGAGSLVTNDIPAWNLAVGRPANVEITLSESA